MTTQIPEIGWEKIVEILIDHGFVEYENHESDITLKKNQTEVRIPKKEILPPIFIKYVIVVTGISKEKFA